MGLLSWLGFKRGDAYPNLDALIKELRHALPDDESVLIRYIAIVVVLVARVAWADRVKAAPADLRGEFARRNDGKRQQYAPCRESGR